MTVTVQHTANMGRGDVITHKSEAKNINIMYKVTHAKHVQKYTHIYIYIRGVKLHVHVDVRGEEPLTAYTYSKRFTGGGCTHNTGQRYILFYIYIYNYIYIYTHAD